MSSNKMATKSDLQEMYSRILPYLGGSADAGFTPIGTIIAVFSETAPANYLICDGATYNKADYPELAAHLLALTTHSQYEVSGDSTKFKVPDLRGEFLRGTGTNGHSGEGNGANVGEHQASTEIPAFQVWNNSNGTSKISVTLRNASDGTSGNVYLNPDSLDSTPTAQRTYINTADVNRISQAQAASYSYAARPTNTSVLFCIATKNIYLNPANDYSTGEKVVGTWIDGSTIYQRTWVVTAPTPTTEAWNVELFSLSGLNIADVIDIKGTYKRSDNQIWNIFNYGFGSEAGAADPLNAYMIFVFIRQLNGLPSAVAINTGKSINVLSGGTVRITLQYTKTTD